MQRCIYDSNEIIGRKGGRKKEDEKCRRRKIGTSIERRLSTKLRRDTLQKIKHDGEEPSVF